MNAPNDARVSDTEVARLALAIWESEGRPEGRDQEHWYRAREILESGEAAGVPGPAQPGFADAVPAMVPEMKQAPEGDELREGSGGRFPRQVADASEEPPGPRNPEPQPPTNPEGYAEAPSDEDTAAAAVSDDPAPLVAGPDARARAKER